MLLYTQYKLNIIVTKVMKDTLWLKIGVTKFDMIR